MISIMHNLNMNISNYDNIFGRGWKVLELEQDLYNICQR